MNLYSTTQFIDGTPFRGELIEEMGECRERVLMYGHKLVHDATFPSSNLGSANRNEYLRVMLASVGERHLQGLKTTA